MLWKVTRIVQCFTLWKVLRKFWTWLTAFKTLEPGQTLQHCSSNIWGLLFIDNVWLFSQKTKHFSSNIFAWYKYKVFWSFSKTLLKEFCLSSNLWPNGQTLLVKQILNVWQTMFDRLVKALYSFLRNHEQKTDVSGVSWNAIPILDFESHRIPYISHACTYENMVDSLTSTSCKGRHTYDYKTP